MAIAASDFVVTSKIPMGVGRYEIFGQYTGPASYTSGGEALSNAILAAKLGIKSIEYLGFDPAPKTTTPTDAIQLAFDYIKTATTQGKIHAYQSGVNAHTHSFLVKGGTAAAGTDALNIKATVIGKEAATDATNTGGVNGGVQAATAANAAGEVAAAQNLSTYVSRFRAVGV